MLLKLSRRLFDDPIEQGAFVDALVNPKPLHPCILWCRDRLSPSPFATEPPRPEQPEGVDRLSLDAQPGKHPLHDQGYYYCLDYSSVIAASVIQAVPQPVRMVVDMCAAPGGKSVFAWRSLHPDVLLSNEVIGKRKAPLIANLKRCRVNNAHVLSLDSATLAEKLPKSADLVIVDAPCTGQSLLAKGGKAPGCFHPVNINKNANRQKRILANSAQIVAPQGYLAYMTCAFSPDENEAVTTWLMKQFLAFQPVAVPMLQHLQSHLSQFPSYRIWPQSGIGAGGFAALFQNTECQTTDVQCLNTETARLRLLETINTLPVERIRARCESAVPDSSTLARPSIPKTLKTQNDP